MRKTGKEERQKNKTRKKGGKHENKIVKERRKEENKTDNKGKE